MCFLKNLLTNLLTNLTNLTTFFQNQATHPQVLSWNVTLFQASSYYSEQRMWASPSIKFISYNQK